MPPKKKSGKRVYQLKVTLRDISPPIWRRIQVTGDATLHELHWTFQAAMGWYNCHLHEFTIADTAYGDPEIDVDGDVANEKVVRMEQVIFKEKEKFYYLYDLGDCWEHEILVEKILPLEKGVRYPICLTGKRACPPEDCGGTPGYESLLEVLKDPSHPEHDDMFAWLPGDLDPDKFDAEEANRRLRLASSKPRKTWT